jgi:hypothetical protein
MIRTDETPGSDTELIADVSLIDKEQSTNKEG